MRHLKTVVIVIFFSFFFVLSACAADNPVAAGAAKVEAEKKAAPAVVEEKKEMTKEDYVRKIKTDLDNMQEIKGFIPGLKEETGPDGKNFYTYEGTKLEDLDKENLGKVYSRVMSEASRVRTERLTRQLESVRRTQQLNNQNRQLSAIQRTQNRQTQPPKSYTVPQVPKVYTPPKVPKVPTVPQTSSRR